MGSCVLSVPLDGMKVNAFTLLSLSVVLNEKLFYLRSSVLFVAFTEVAGAKSKTKVVSTSCVHKCGGFVVSG